MTRRILIIIVLLTASMPANSQQALRPKFSHPEIIRYDNDAFIINGKDTFIFSGSLHYSRCDPAQWIDILEKIKTAGFNTVDTYVPWNFHEQVEGKPNFSLLDKFLDDCQRMDMYVIFRVGPYLCGEWDEGGFPQWLAGKGIGFRTGSPKDIYWSRYWYNEVLPIVHRHLITNAGSIILVQIENEYNYSGVPDSLKVPYIKSLYHDVIRNRIDVPIITCWTKEVRDKTDSVFSQIMDAGNFYPGWNFQATLPRLNLLKEQQPYSPAFSTELQGGWFTAIGDKEVRQLNRFSAGQINGLTKFMLAHGLKGFNYYMLYGGTNFEYWAGKGKTTSYDYTAPISECGGLWEKYYSVKLIGDFLKYAQPYLNRCQEITGGATSANPEIETVLRSDGKIGFVFVWNKSDKSQSVDVHVEMPGQAPFSISISIEARDAYFLPVNLPIFDDNLLHYSNVQISTITKYNGKSLVIAYGTSGEKATIDLGSRTFSESISSRDHLYNLNGFYVLLTSRDRAGRGTVFDTKKGQTVLLSDSYFALADTHYRHTNLVKLQTKPGKDEFTLIATGGVKRIRLDGKPVTYREGQDDKLIHFALNTPTLPVPRIALGPFRYRMDTEAEKSPYFKNMPTAKDGLFPSLDSLGNHQNGYSVYQGTFELDGEHVLRVDYYADDWHSIFIDGKPVEGLTSRAFEDYARLKLENGVHSIGILYQNEGRPNSGFMEEKKGLKSMSVLSPEHVRTLEKWKYSIQLAPQLGPHPAEADTAYDDSGWMNINVGNGTPDSVNKRQIGSWYRREITLSENETNEDPRLVFEGMSRSASIYANGKLVYNFSHHGWNPPFTVPISANAKAGKILVAVYVENSEGKGGITRPIRFGSGKEKPLKFLQLTYHALLNGELAGWQMPDYADTSWKTVQKSDSSDSRIKWYRTWFTVPSYKSWVVPWRVHVESTGDLQIWLNGRLLGRYYAVGPQKDFYMPDGWLLHGKRNSLVLVMHPSDVGEVAPVLNEVTIVPYSEYVVQKHELEFDQ